MTITTVEKGKFFMIRHKATGQIMPLFKRNRGYSLWNPSTNPSEHPRSMKVPRILQSEKQANRCIVMWNLMPNAKERFYEDGPEVDFRPDGRKKEDLEVVAVKLYEVNK